MQECGFDVCFQWEELVSHGITLVHKATSHARDRLKEYTLIPVIDTVRINGQGDSEEVSFPLFSCLEEEGLSRFFEYQRRIEQWGQSLTEFLGFYGIEWDGE